MAFIRFKGFVASSACALALLLASSAYAQEAISEEAKLYFRNGVELLESQPPNYQDAYFQFKLAYEKSNSWKVLGNLGLCALKLERDGEALGYYKEYLDRGGKDIEPEERAQLERDLLLVNGNSAILRLTSVVAGAEVTDSRAGSTVPPQGYKFQGDALELRLRAGTHTLTATSPDGKTQRWEVALSPGKEVAHTFDFVAPAAPPKEVVTPPGQSTPAAEQKSGSGLRTAGFVTAGVGGAALIAGVVVRFVIAPGKADDAKEQCSNNICPTSAEADMDSANSMATVGTILMIGGGVVAAAGVGLIIAGGSSGSEQAVLVQPKPRLRLTPAVAHNGAGLWATGSF